MLALAAALVAIALAYFTKEQGFSLYTSWQMLTSIVVFALAFACFCLAILGKAFPPWDKLKFPDIYFEVCSSSTRMESYTYPNGTESPFVLGEYRVRITNMEREQNACLTIRIFLKLEPGSYGPMGEAEGIPLERPLESSIFSVNIIQMPIVVIPGTTVGGDLAFRTFLDWGRLDESRQARFEIMDHISRKRMSIIDVTHLGVFGVDNMIPSSGEPEILGPEYKFENDGEAISSEQTPPSS